MQKKDIENILCVSCLCIGRRLKKLSESLNKFYMDALYEIPLSNVVCIQPEICWECEALLKKWLTFREQVKDSYRILQTYTVENLQECLLSDVSRPPRLKAQNLDSVNILPFQEVKVEYESGFSKKDTDSCQVSDADDANYDELRSVMCEIKNEYDDGKDDLSLKYCADIKDEVEKNDRVITVENVNIINNSSNNNTDMMKNSKRRVNRVKGKKNRRERDDSKSRYQCQICKNVLTSDEELTAHYENHIRSSSDGKQLKPHSKKRVQCTECEKTFSHRAGLMNHRITVHEAQNEFPCKVCKKVFRWKTSLKRHFEKHAANTQTPEAFCSSCGIGFGSVASLQRHLRNSLKHVTPDQLKFTCEHCKRRFADKTKLRDHIEGKHMHRTYQCYICDKPSKNRVGLEQHIRNVHKGRPNNKMCHHCGKGFPTKVQLESHIRTHTGERPFICEYCPTTFSQQSNLYKHHRQVHQSIRMKKKKPPLKKSDVTIDSNIDEPTLPIAVIQYMALPDNMFAV
ncbi:unnamed protein product [Leptosia nina]|uniref:C2H2-type domain-containing protein n=1 Tax=Leptosia nina TaxID=320188 RepID=A0AAV1JUG9_9NEOP